MSDELKEVKKNKKFHILKLYELDAEVAPCVKDYKITNQTFDFTLKNDFDCENCLSETCFYAMEHETVKKKYDNVMYI